MAPWTSIKLLEYFKYKSEEYMILRMYQKEQDIQLKLKRIKLSWLLVIVWILSLKQHKCKNNQNLQNKKTLIQIKKQNKLCNHMKIIKGANPIENYLIYHKEIYLFYQSKVNCQYLFSLFRQLTKLDQNILSLIEVLIAHLLFQYLNIIQLWKVQKSYKFSLPPKNQTNQLYF